MTDEPTADRARRLYDQIGWPMANEVFNRVAGDVPPGPIAIPPQPGKPPRFWPLGEGRIVTSPFGPRDGSFHAGTDFGRAGGSAGMPVYACQGGTVIYAGAAQGYGGPDPAGWLVIDHPTEDGSGCTEYGHIIREVAKGDRVAAGQRIGHINPDRATNGGVAPHLHLSVMPREYDPQAKMDPMPWLTGALEPGTARGDVVWLADVLRAEGLNVIEYSGWKTRHNGDHFDDVWGVVCHHTGSFNTTAATIANGRPDLDGPLSQIHLAPDGTVTVVAAGCANHAGTGNWPDLGLHQGNRRAIGIEPAHDGKAAWSAAQRDAYVKCCAAINRKVGNDGSHTIAHWEYDDGDPATDEGKWDPGNLDMNRFRADVKARVASGGEAGLFMPNISANDAAIVVAAAKKIMAMWDNDDLSKRHAWSSRAIYRDDDNPVDDTIEMLLNTEGNAHDSQVEVEALMGNPTYIAKVRRLAEGKGPGAKNPDGSPNTDNISRARLVLKRCPDVTTGPAPEAPPSPAKKTTRKKKTAPTEQVPS